MPLLILPRSIAIGDIISYANYKMSTKEGRKNRYTFAGSEYFKRMQEVGLYTTDVDKIVNNIKKLNLYNIFNEKII